MTSVDETNELTDARLDMGIDPYERNWMRLSIAMLIGFFAIITVAGFAMGFQVNGAESEVDPRIVADSAPWNEPGLREISDGVYEAYILGQAWSFSPRELTVPIGSEVTFYITSTDLQHGFKIADTNINVMVVPGQVSKLTYTFDTPGNFAYICHEYCGKGHATMFGSILVLDDEQSTTEDGAGE